MKLYILSEGKSLIAISEDKKQLKEFIKLIKESDNYIIKVNDTNTSDLYYDVFSDYVLEDYYGYPIRIKDINSIKYLIEESKINIFNSIELLKVLKNNSNIDEKYRKTFKKSLSAIKDIIQEDENLLVDIKSIIKTYYSNTDLMNDVNNLSSKKYL